MCDHEIVVNFSKKLHLFLLAILKIVDEGHHLIIFVVAHRSIEVIVIFLDHDKHPTYGIVGCDSRFLCYASHHKRITINQDFLWLSSNSFNLISQFSL